MCNMCIDLLVTDGYHWVMNNIEAYLHTQPTLTPAVVGFLLRGNNVLLGERKRVSGGLGHLLMAGIGGKLEPGETEDQALKRECEEEIGIQITSWRKVAVEVYLFPHKPEWNQVVGVYIIDSWRGEPHETTDIRPEWLPQDQLPAGRMWPDNLITIPLVTVGKRFKGIFLYAEDGSIAEYTLQEQ